jgi:hypothetical protein
MTAWLSDYWYVLTAIGGGLILLAAHTYARRHPDTQFASHWERLKYTAFACAPIGGVLILLNAGLELWAPDYSIGPYFFSPWFMLLLFAACWMAAPSLRRLFPLERGSH